MLSQSDTDTVIVILIVSSMIVCNVMNVTADLQSLCDLRAAHISILACLLREKSTLLRETRLWNIKIQVTSSARAE